MMDEMGGLDRDEERGDRWSSAAGALAVLGAIGAGAALMYLLDPERGAARRARLRERVTGALRDVEERLDARGRDIANRARGRLARTRAKLTPEDVDDEVLVGRVRAELGHHIANAGAIEVASEGRIVTLSGMIAGEEIDRALEAVRRVRGVRDVVSLLEVPAAPSGIDVR